jgi:hypothetical protein
MQTLETVRLESAATAAGAAIGGPLGPDFRDAWRQLHYAAQAASEVAKAWATPQPDDSHSSFTWEGRSLLGARVAAPRPFRAALEVPTLTLALRDERGTQLAAHPLDGTTLAAALAWSRAEAERLAGEPARQPAVPAPDLPPHPIATGAAFALGHPARFAALGALLAGAHALLGELFRQLGVAGPVRVWPHHFDMAALAAFGTDRSLGAGLAVPDAIAPSGYWYVSPWAARTAASGASWPALAHGRWAEHGGPLPMAVFALDDWSALPTAAARSAALTRFLADAVRTGRERLGG